MLKLNLLSKVLKSSCSAVVYSKKLILVKNIFVLENFGAKELGSCVYVTDPNRYGRVEDTYSTRKNLTNVQVVTPPP